MKYKIGDTIIYKSFDKYTLMYEVCGANDQQYRLKPLFKEGGEKWWCAMCIIDNDPTYRRYDIMKELIYEEEGEDK